MAYLIVDPTCSALMKQLCDADRQRDHLRAQLADAALQVDLKEVERDMPWGFTPEKRAEVKAQREAALQERIAKRAARRANEMRIFGSYTRPGTWDEDLDNYPEPRYEEALPDGYSIRLVRARDLTWNGYVVLPASHPAAGRHYDFFGGYESPSGLPLPPQNLTYNAVEEERGVFGFYLTGIVKPRDNYGDYRADNFYSVEKTGYSPVTWSVHVDYAHMRRLCVELVDYFKGLAANQKHAAICRDAIRCANHRFYVGVCEGCAAPPRYKAPVTHYKVETTELPASSRYGTLDAATGVYTPQTREEFGKSLRADIARAVANMSPIDLTPKKSWAQVAAAK
jgi:hypothetical protein